MDHIYTVLKNKDFILVILQKKKKKEEIDVFLELSCFFHDPADVGNWSLVLLPFLKQT